MTHRKQGLGLLGLLLAAALGIMAFAASAQAVTPLFSINGAAALHATASGNQEETGTLLVPNSNLSLTCAEFEVLEGLVAAGGASGKAKLLYKGCTAGEHKAAGSLPCHVSDVAGGKPELLHVTASATLLPVELADGGFGVLAEGVVVQVNFLSGTGCPLPLKNVVKGEVCFRVTAGNNTTEPLIKSSKTIQAECPEVKLEGTGSVAKDVLLFGANEAFVEGKALLKLTTAHTGQKLGVLLL
jgi:hypothetical protein